MKRRISRLICAVWLTILFLGCGGNQPQPVQGKIVFSDATPAKDLAGYTVSIDSVEQNVSATGVVRPDGTFQVGTNAPDDGALPGKYRVSLTPPEPPLDQPAPKPIIDPKYSKTSTSGLEVEIKPGVNPVTLTVERAKP